MSQQQGWAEAEVYMPIFRLIVRSIPALFPLIIHSKLNMYT